MMSIAGQVALGLCCLTALVCSLLYSRGIVVGITPELVSSKKDSSAELASRGLISTDEDAFRTIKSSLAFLERHARHDDSISSATHNPEIKHPATTTPMLPPTAASKVTFTAANNGGNTKSKDGKDQPLRSVVLILRNWRDERKDYLLKLYRPFFLDVIFADRDIRINEVMLSIIDEVRTKYPTCQGLLSMHMDMWIQPSRLADEIATGSLWFSGPGLTYNGVGKDRCFNRDELAREASSPHWNWWDNSRDRSEVAIAKLHSALDLPPDEISICIGWQDLFYLPKAAWSGYQKIVPFLVDVKFDEVIIPTAMHALAKLERRSALFLNRCWGSCCDKPTEDPVIIHEHVCGHRMNLSSAAARKALWEANHPTTPFEEA